MHNCKVYFCVDLPYNEEKFRLLLANKVNPSQIKPQQIGVLHAEEVAAAFKQLGCKVEKHLHTLVIDSCDKYNPIVCETAEYVLRNLLGNGETLKQLKQQYNLNYWLEIVPQIDCSCDQPKPCISPSDKMIAFLHESQTSLDIDYYVV